MKRRALPTRKKVNVAVECTVCMTTFKHDTTFPAHMKAHETKVDLSVPIPCPVCSIEVESRKSLNPHIKDHHPDKGGCCVECLEFMPVSSFLGPVTKISQGFTERSLHLRGN